MRGNTPGDPRNSTNSTANRVVIYHDFTSHRTPRTATPQITFTEKLGGFPAFKIYECSSDEEIMGAHRQNLSTVQSMEPEDLTSAIESASQEQVNEKPAYYLAVVHELKLRRKEVASRILGLQRLAGLPTNRPPAPNLFVLPTPTKTSPK